MAREMGGREVARGDTYHPLFEERRREGQSRLRGNKMLRIGPRMEKAPEPLARNYGVFFFA